MKKITKERYEEIKKHALDCINMFVANQNQFQPISYYFNQFNQYLNNDEERILFRNMVLFPNSKTLLDDYKQEKNITKLANKYGVQKITIQSKISNISCYEGLYENEGYLTLSEVDVLKINSDIIKVNNYMDETIKMINNKKNISLERNKHKK
ncbi:MAG: hypothetical protein IJO32_03865 [Bacilli bacterium]|nr:hypothetical protein [Bacilli bacterium]